MPVGSRIHHRVPGLRLAAATTSHPQARYVASPLNPSAAGLDSVLALLNGLAATKPENALLLQQGKARYLGLGTIAGKRFERYRSGSLTLWLASDGTIRHVSAFVNSYASPVGIDLLEHARQAIGVPTKASVVAITAVPALKGQLALQPPRQRGVRQGWFRSSPTRSPKCQSSEAGGQDGQNRAPVQAL